jgi:hypothetical protein
MSERSRTQCNEHLECQRVTNKPLPLHFIDIKPSGNNKEMYKINTLLNTTVQFEAPHAKREIPQCMRCQKFAHPKKLLQK